MLTFHYIPHVVFGKFGVLHAAGWKILSIDSIKTEEMTTALTLGLCWLAITSYINDLWEDERLFFSPHSDFN